LIHQDLLFKILYAYELATNYDAHLVDDQKL